MVVSPPRLAAAAAVRESVELRVRAELVNTVCEAIRRAGARPARLGLGRGFIAVEARGGVRVKGLVAATE